ncbi:urease subunit beta [Acuticoccus mangrovi]|uniref:urease n=1 Tax=Acuticoccus mangrovi TaxID=2796142 RepID=A0A934ISP9_9HYPH|nr:urease subunit beta [Acuticoccus mangrovi]
MNLTPTEFERLTIFSAAEFARRNRRDGIRLSHPEAVALIADEMLHAARKGMAYAEIVDMAGKLLSADDVEPGVAGMIPHVMVEGNFEEGTKLLVVFDPIGVGEAAGPAPPQPGEILCREGEIALLPGRERVRLDVLNTGDRDIQVRSHTHFFEVNKALDFDRAKAFGMKLDAPSGVGVRFEPGLRKSVTLVPLGGTGEVHGEAGLTQGSTRRDGVRAEALAAARARGYRGA